MQFVEITYFQRFKLSDITLKTTENGAIRQNAHDFLLVFYCNYCMRNYCMPILLQQELNNYCW